jgi:hypothetical protein
MMQKTNDETVIGTAYLDDMKISDILGLLRKSSTTSDAQADVVADTLDRDAASGALAQLDAQRAETRRAVDAAMRRRGALLLNGGSDGEIAKLDRELDRLRLDLERCDLAEPILLDAVADARAMDHRQGLAEIAEEYEAALVEFGRAMHAAADRRLRLNDIRDFAVGAGHHQAVHYLEVPVQITLDAGDIDRFVSAARATLSHAVIVPPPTIMFPVMFHEPHGPFRTGEVAGFAARDAWALVKAGVAIWAPGTRPPPVPVETTEGASA